MVLKFAAAAPRAISSNYSMGQSNRCGTDAYGEDTVMRNPVEFCWTAKMAPDIIERRAPNTSAADRDAFSDIAASNEALRRTELLF
jgi:hypothetical protein